MANPVSAVQPAIPQDQNIAPCVNQTPGAMATDFFGSQAFGNPMQMQPAPSFASIQPDDVASALVQNSYAQNSPACMSAAGATMEDYARATQIANQFANSQPLTSPNTSYFENDYFAQQLIQPQYNNNNCAYSGMNNGVNYSVNNGMNYNMNYDMNYGMNYGMNNGVNYMA